MSKIYKIEAASNLGRVNTFYREPPHNIKARESFCNIKNFNLEPGEVTFPHFKLDSRTQPTDILKHIFEPQWLFLTKSLYKDLTSQGHKNREVYDIVVKKGSKIIEGYCALYHRFDQNQKIVWEDCSFRIIDLAPPFDQRMFEKTIASLEEYNKLQKEHRLQYLALKGSKLIVDHSTPDLFYIATLAWQGYYCTDKVKDLVEIKKYTGFSFKEIGQQLENTVS